MQPDLGWTNPPSQRITCQSHTHTSSEPSLLPIERPLCPKCQGRLMLARIEPGPNGADLRTFECPNCEYVLQTLVENPMKSGNAGWINSALKSPN
jgi:uncharacterized protein YlaI